MRHEEAIRELRRALSNQRSITIPKLQKLLSDANIALKSSESVEVKYLKQEIRKRDTEIRRLKKLLGGGLDG